MKTHALKDKLLDKTQKLKPVEKLQLIDALLENLDKQDPEIDKLWVKEADERYEAYKKGELKTTCWEEIKKSTNN
ncbi:MAG TPA: addiction module protein [bacterium]|nr:addiction module protein [bacterium]HPN44239.1 addiction module protein [bacterium]